MATELLYLNDFGVVTCTANVQEINKDATDRGVIILDQTCFYPRGGGQDWDTGMIISDTAKFLVEEVRLDETGTVQHIGTFQTGSFSDGEEVRCKVDPERRDINTQLHSAGHVVDMAVDSLGYNWIPGRGAHYPHMSFVEYQGELSEEASSITSAIQKVIDDLVSSTADNILKFVNKEELAQYCRHVPDNIPSNKPTRLVLYGNFGVPCGGTHVRNLSEIGKLEVTKIKSKKGFIKVSYRIEGVN